MRGKRASKRKIAPDPKYNNVVVAKFINYIMKSGKKNTARTIVYDAFEILKQTAKKHNIPTNNPIDIFDHALKNVGPLVEVRGKRIGGANYQIPMQVRSDRRQALSFRWLIEAATNRKGKPMKEKLALELIDAYNKTGAAIKKKEDVYRMAEANRAFAHFAR
jgi:small subunit ribosomal protein S7